MGSAPAPPIPTRLEEMTPEWLTDALRAGGSLGGGRVVAAKREALGEGEGFMGVIARIALEYDRPEAGAPASLVAKLPTPVDENRVMGELMGAYRREINFYEGLADRMPFRLPRAYYRDATPDPARGRQEVMVGILDHLPLWFVNWLTEQAKKMTLGQDKRYVLLIEDLAPASVGDQVRGAAPERCAAVLAEVGLAHARFWERREELAPPWIARQDLNPRMRHAMYLDVRPAFDARYPALLDAGLREVMAWIDRNGVALVRALHREAPHTWIHCDLRLDNVFFDDAGVALVDFQLVGKGAAAYDVAYFLSGALDADTPPETVEQLLRAYWEGLVSEGVSGYAWERFLRDYRRGLLAVMELIATTDTMDMGAGRGVELMDLWVERTAARLRGVELGALL